MLKRGEIFVVIILCLAYALAGVYAYSFSDTGLNDFNNGTYVNMTYDSTLNAVVLNLSNRRGEYTSRIFDAGAEAMWENFSFNNLRLSRTYLIAVDAAADVWRSDNYGANWTLRKDDYNGGDGNGVSGVAVNKNNTLFFLYNQDVWKSENYGLNWTKVNDNYNGAESNNGLVIISGSMNEMYIAEGDEDVWKSSDYGLNWTKATSNFNGANGAARAGVANSLNNLFLVDAAADVWKSDNGGVNWTLAEDDFNNGDSNSYINGITVDKNDNLYIIVNQDVWKSENSGINWTKVNDDYNNGDSNQGLVITVDAYDYLYIIDASEDVFVSYDYGANWTKVASDFNGANGNVGGIAAMFVDTNLSFQFRNCSLQDCSDNVFSGPSRSVSNYYIDNVNEMHLRGRYFQYRAFFDSGEQGLSARLFNTSLEYFLSDTDVPQISVYSPINRSYNTNVILINLSAQDTTLRSLWFFNGTVNVTYVSETYQTYEDGSYSLIFYANDSVGNINSTRVYFSVDTVKPLISFVQPGNVSYQTSEIDVKYTVYDLSLQSCWYSNDLGKTNQSIVCGENTTYPALQGHNSLRIYANDSAGNMNFTNVYFFVDSIKPLINYGENTRLNGTAVSQDWVYININLIEDNFGNVTYYLYNTTGLVDVASYSGEIYWHNFTGLQDGLYFYKVEIYDTAGNFNNTETRTIILDRTSPGIVIAQPTSDNYGYNVSISLNYSVFDSGLGVQACWYSIDGSENIILANCQNTSFSTSEGQHTVFLYSNDTLNNLGAANVTFNIQIGPPSVFLDGTSGWINYKENVYFNFTPDDVDRIVECELWIDDGFSWVLNMTNQSAIFKGLVNSFVLNLNDGSYLWNVKCRDEQNNSAFSLVNRSLNVDILKPFINLNFPVNNTVFLRNVSLLVNFSVSEENLQSCWRSFDNGKSNYSFLDCTTGSNLFFIGYSDGNYNLTVYANDSAENIGVYRSYNLSITHDDIRPNLIVSQPSGTKTSRINIPIELNVFDNDELSSCMYNVSWSTGASVIGNTFINNCENTDFDVSADGSYFIFVFVNDTTGNNVLRNSSFSVSTGINGGGDNTGGGGGGGGGSSFKTFENETGNESLETSRTVDLEISDVGDVVARNGEIKTLRLKLKNTGKAFLNDCKLKGKQDFEGWINSKQVTGLSVGESVDFVFTLQIPPDVAAGNYNVNLIVSCDEVNAETDFDVSLIIQNVKVYINSSKQDGNSLNVFYTLIEDAGQNRSVIVDVSLFDSFGLKQSFSEETITLDSNEMVYRKAVLSLANLTSSEYTLSVTVSSDDESAKIEDSVKENVFIVSGPSGFAIFGESGGKIFFYGLLVLIIGVIGFFVYKKFFGKKAGKEEGESFGVERIRTKTNRRKRF